MKLRSAASFGFTIFSAGRLLADGPTVPDINDCGVITHQRPVPAYELRNVHLPATVGDSNGRYNCEIKMVFQNQGELPLQTYFYLDTSEGNIDRKEKVNWDYVSGRKIALGWLGDATNLLVVSWGDSSASHGTGHYEGQWYIIAALKARKNSVLLRRNVCTQGRQRDVSHGPGLGTHYFSFDPTRQVLS